ncbi:MAG: type 4a pilus biogenesis protein PilO [Gammaproteobacteria bacterium]|nr:type 4a pilus biogenesis protein PilO [Gammaproteobacteria bacterium]
MQAFLKNVSLRELRLLLLGIGAVITAAAIVGFVAPNVKALRAANNEVAVLEEAAQDGTELEQQLQRQHATIEELRYRLYGNMASLPSKQVEAYIIGRLQRVSWNNNVELVSVEPAIGDRVQMFQEMLFNVQLVGQYSDLYHWLRDAREDLGYVVIKEYSLRRHDSVDDQPRLFADLSLASYRTTE